MLNKIIKFFLDNKLVTAILLIIFITWGIVTSPFSWETGFLPKDPVKVDAIPDIGETGDFKKIKKRFVFLCK